MIFLDDNFPEHDKVIAVGGDAAWLYVCGLGWLKRKRSTDGRLPKVVLSRLSDRKNPEKLAARLIAERMWHDDGDAWIVNDYTERNAKAIARSEKNRLNARKRWDAEKEPEPCEDDANAGAIACDSHMPQSTVHCTQSTVHSPRQVSGANANQEQDPLGDDELERLLDAAAECHADHQAKTVAVKNDKAWRPKVKANYRTENADLLAYYAKTRRTGYALWQAVETHGQQKVLEKPLAPDNGGVPDMTATANDRATARALLERTA